MNRAQVRRVSLLVEDSHDLQTLAKPGLYVAGCSLQFPLPLAAANVEESGRIAAWKFYLAPQYTDRGTSLFNEIRVVMPGAVVPPEESDEGGDFQDLSHRTCVRFTA